MRSQGLAPSHLILALAVVAVWGTNFVVIKVALDDLPPLLFAVLRFTFAFVPAALFLRRPAVPWRDLIAYGLLIGAGQFGVLYLAMDGHASPGIASLVIQTQVFFTIGLSMALSGERLRRDQWLALTLAVAGLGVILGHTDGSTTPLGLGLLLLAALSWALGNLVVRRSVGADMLAYVVWASLFSIPPLIVLSLVFEGPDVMLAGIARADTATWLAVAWQSAGNTLFGFACWGFLLSRYPAATIAPMALLVPVFGMAASTLALGEPLPGWKLLAAVLIIGGLAFNLFAPRLRQKAPPAPL